MQAIVLKANLRFWGKHPGQLALALLGIMLGVGAVVSVDLAEQGARRAMDIATRSVLGAATHHIVAGPNGVDEIVYSALRVQLAQVPAAPVITAALVVDGQSPMTLSLLGIDPLAAAALAPTWRLDPGAGGAAANAGVAARLITRPAVVLDRDTAARLGVAVGDPMHVTIGGQRQGLQLAGYLSGNPDPSVMVADISTAQELLGAWARLTRIDLRLDGDTQEVAELLPPDHRLVPAQTQIDATQRLTDAFHTNLKALSLLAMLMGLFLIYNTQSFLVVQRRALLGSLRSLGVTRRQILAHILLETVCIACVGTLLGLVFGVLLGQGLLQLNTATISDLYLRVTVNEIIVAPVSLAKGALVGLCGALLAAILPAWEASTQTTSQGRLRSHLEARFGRIARSCAAVGMAGGILGGAFLTLGPQGLHAGFVALFVVILAMLLTVPYVLRAATLGALPRLRVASHPLLHYSLRSAGVGLSRTGVALAALTLALATSVGIRLMVDSFRDSVDAWLGQLLRADLYVSSGDSVGRDAQGGLPRALAAQIGGLAGVRRTTTARRVQLVTRRGPLTLVAYDLHREAFDGFRLTAGDADDLWVKFRQRDVVLLSEPFAFHHGLTLGGQLLLPTDAGERPFTVGGIYTDYGSDRGVVALSRSIYDRHWRDDRVSGIGVYRRPGTSLADLQRDITALSAQRPLMVVDNATLRANSLAIFDRTFEVTSVLQVLASVIAFFGLLSAFMALQLERMREFSVLRAVGITPGQLRRLLLLEAGSLGLLAGLLALPLGITMAAILVHVINRRSFGWTMDMSIDTWLLVQCVGLAVFAGLLAALYPGQRAARLNVADGLRIE